MVEDRCKTCNARILWADIGGKRIPLNYARVRVYEPIVRNGDVFVEVSKVGSDQPQLYYVSHFLTCPQRDRWSGQSR